MAHMTIISVLLASKPSKPAPSSLQKTHRLLQLSTIKLPQRHKKSGKYVDPENKSGPTGRPNDKSKEKESSSCGSSEGHKEHAPDPQQGISKTKTGPKFKSAAKKYTGLKDAPEGTFDKMKRHSRSIGKKGSRRTLRLLRKKDGAGDTNSAQPSAQQSPRSVAPSEYQGDDNDVELSDAPETDVSKNMLPDPSRCLQLTDNEIQRRSFSGPGRDLTDPTPTEADVQDVPVDASDRHAFDTLGKRSRREE